MRADWLADVLRAEGLPVAEVDGWRGRGTLDRDDHPRDMPAVEGVLFHHTAGPRSGNMPSLGTLLRGRPDLRGPLAHTGLGRDGTWYVVAAGRCNHAGAGNWRGITDANGRMIGVEAENTGIANDSPWPDVQLDSAVRGVAAILRHIGRDEGWLAGHKEYALPHGRKDDPDFDMGGLRLRVARQLGTQPAPPPDAPPPPPPPPPPPAAPPFPLPEGWYFGPKTGPRESVSGYYSHRDDLARWQRRMAERGWRITVDGLYGDQTGDVAEAFQRQLRLPADRLVGHLTWSPAWTAPIT